MTGSDYRDGVEQINGREYRVLIRADGYPCMAASRWTGGVQVSFVAPACGKALGIGGAWRDVLRRAIAGESVFTLSDLGMLPESTIVDVKVVADRLFSFLNRISALCTGEESIVEQRLFSGVEFSAVGVKFLAAREEDLAAPFLDDLRAFAVEAFSAGERSEKGGSE